MTSPQVTRPSKKPKHSPLHDNPMLIVSEGNHEAIPRIEWPTIACKKAQTDVNYALDTYQPTLGSSVKRWMQWWLILRLVNLIGGCLTPQLHHIMFEYKYPFIMDTTNIDVGAILRTHTWSFTSSSYLQQWCPKGLSRCREGFLVTNKTLQRISRVQNFHFAELPHNTE